MSAHTRILHIAHGIPSYNNSLVEMLGRLRKHNIELCVASHVDLSAIVSECDVRFVHLQRDVLIKAELQEHKKKLNIDRSLGGILRGLSLQKQYRRESLKMRELQNLVEEIKPDLLLIDMECHVAIIQLYASNIKIMLCSRWFSVFRQAGVPPMHTELTPSASPFNTLKISISWYRLWMFKWWLNLRYKMSRQALRPISYACNARSDLVKLARHNGLDLTRITNQHDWLIPHTYNRLPVMSFTSKALEFGDKPDSRMHYVGPMVGEPHDTSERFRDSVEQITLFVNRCADSRSRKLVYCSLSTFWDTQGSIFQTLASLGRDKQDIDFIIGMGGRQVPDYFRNLPENMLALAYAPQLELMKYADAVITHGGISTINEALYHGVPLLVCSSGHVDQNGCAARVAYHGVGLVTPADAINSKNIERLIDELFDSADDRIQQRVRHIQKYMKQQKKNDDLVKCIHHELNNSPTSAAGIE